MAAPQRLGNGQLTPSARPVSNFLQFKTDGDPAQPTRQSLLGQVSGVNMIQRQSDRSIQGVNPIAELTEALKPLTELYDYGAELYASDQYKRGQNEVLQAAANINRDTIAKSFAYAAENREVSAVNPVAGVLMDEANPFRRAGRINQASQYVSSIAGQHFRGKWAATAGNLTQLDPTDPAVLATQSRAASDLANAFGLDEFSPGFQQYVIPEINKGWEWFQKEHLTANNKYKKEVGATQTGAILMSKLLAGEELGSIATFLGTAAAQFGIAGEPLEMTKRSMLHAGKLLTTAMQSGDPAMQSNARKAYRVLMQMPSGIPGLSVNMAYGDEMTKAQAQSSRDVKTIKDNEEAAMLDGLEQKYGNEMLNIPFGSPEWIDMERRMLEDAPNLSPVEIREFGGRYADANRDFDERITNIGTIEDLFDTSDQVGSGYNEANFRKRANEIIKNLPETQKAEVRARVQGFIDRKRREQSGELDRPTADDQAKNYLERALQTKLGKDGLAMIKSARLAGVPITTYLRDYDQNLANGTQRFSAALQQRGEDAIAEATFKNGGILSPSQQSAIWTEVGDKMLADEKLMNTFFDIKENAESNSSSTADPAAPAAPAAPQEIPQWYNPSAPVPKEVIESGAPVYNPEKTIQLLGLLMDGKPLPANVQRAAREAGMTPGEFVLRNADTLSSTHPELKVPDSMRQQIRRSSNQSKGLSDAFATAAPSGTNPLAVASRILLDVLAPPAAAATLPPRLPVAATEAPISVDRGTQYIATTGFGKSADGMTQTLHGIVGRNGYDKNHGVGNDHVHHGAPDKTTALALANYLKARGIPITEFSPWTSVAPVHQDPGHYNGMSMDIPVGVEEHEKVLRLIDSFYRSR